MAFLNNDAAVHKARNQKYLGLSPTGITKGPDYITGEGPTGLDGSGNEVLMIRVNSDGTVELPNGGIVSGESLTSPKITTGLGDTNGNQEIGFTATASAVNNINVANAALSSGPVISAVGTDTNIPITVKGKGTGAVILGQATSTDLRLAADQPIADSSGNPYISFVKTTTAVNGIGITNAATGNGATNPVVIAPIGSDSAVGLTITPKAAGGVLTLGLSTGTADILLGSSSGAQSVKVANGAGAPTVNIANVSTAGSTVAIAGAATAGAAVDTVNIATGNAASTAAKKVNIATGVPNTSGNNQVVIGGGATSAVTLNAVVRSYQTENYIATESGANNALVASLVDAAGNNVTVAAGLAIRIKLAHTLQAGANTLNLNGHGTDSIKKASAPGTDVAVVAASGSIIQMVFDGSVWQVTGQ